MQFIVKFTQTTETKRGYKILIASISYVFGCLVSPPFSAAKPAYNPLRKRRRQSCAAQSKTFVTLGKQAAPLLILRTSTTACQSRTRTRLNGFRKSALSRHSEPAPAGEESPGCGVRCLPSDRRKPNRSRARAFLRARLKRHSIGEQFPAFSANPETAHTKPVWSPRLTTWRGSGRFRYSLLPMLDLGYVRGHLELIEQMARNRRASLDLATFREIDGERRRLITSTEVAKADRNKASEEIAKLKKSGADASEILARMKTGLRPNQAER